MGLDAHGIRDGDGKPVLAFYAVQSAADGTQLVKFKLQPLDGGAATTSEYSVTEGLVLPIALSFDKNGATVLGAITHTVTGRGELHSTLSYKLPDSTEVGGVVIPSGVSYFTGGTFANAADQIMTLRPTSGSRILSGRELAVKDLESNAEKIVKLRLGVTERILDSYAYQSPADASVTNYLLTREHQISMTKTKTGVRLVRRAIRSVKVLRDDGRLPTVKQMPTAPGDEKFDKLAIVNFDQGNPEVVIAGGTTLQVRSLDSDKVLLDLNFQTGIDSLATTRFVSGGKYVNAAVVSLSDGTVYVLPFDGSKPVEFQSEGMKLLEATTKAAIRRKVFEEEASYQWNPKKQAKAVVKKKKKH